MDVFLSSGMSDPYDYWPNAFLENLGNQFQQRQADLGLDPPPGGKYNSSIRVDGQVYVSSTRTAASADFNEDGALDMVVVRWNDTANLYLNRLPAGSHWLDIDLVGHPTHDPYGSSIEVVAGGATYVRSMEAAHGYFSQSSRTVHFGLGSAIAVTSVTVKWLGGASQIVPPPAVDSHITVTQSP